MNSEFEASRAATQFLVDGHPVDPHLVQLRLSDEGPIKPLRFEMRIGTVILVHELEEAGVDLSSTSLEDFVRTDLQDNGEVAVNGYLGFVQAVSNEPAVAPKGFLLHGIEKIYLDNQALVIAGFASNAG